jgi:hypothetical protein
MSVRNCPDRWVSSLQGQVVTFTGVVNIDAHHLPRSECERQAGEQGASTATDFSGRITLVVEGDLDGKAVTDPARGYSKKLVGAQDARLRGRPHMHVVDSDGFADLLEGLPARCRNLRGSGKNVQIAPEIGDGVLGGPLRPRAAVAHGAAELATDMSVLDAGTKASPNHRPSPTPHRAARGSRNLPVRPSSWLPGSWRTHD